MSEWPQSLVLVGAGKMGEALLAAGSPAASRRERVTILEPKPSPAIAALAAERGIALNPPSGTRRAPEALFLAIKPQSLEAAAPALTWLAGPDTLAISILAGNASPTLRRGCRARAPLCGSCRTRPPPSAAALRPAPPAPRRAPSSAAGRKADGRGRPVRLARRGSADRRGDGDFRLRPGLCVRAGRSDGGGRRQAGAADRTGDEAGARHGRRRRRAAASRARGHRRPKLRENVTSPAAPPPPRWRCCGRPTAIRRCSPKPPQRPATGRGNWRDKGDCALRPGLRSATGLQWCCALVRCRGSPAAP